MRPPKRIINPKGWTEVSKPDAKLYENERKHTRMLENG